MAVQPSFTAAMARDIIEHERFPTRFEAFCVELMSAVEDCQYVGTSRSWDLGRDGRGVLSRGKVAPLICCGTEEDVADKAEKDAKRLKEFTTPPKITFCFTDGSFSELKANKIEAATRAVFPEIESVQSFGADQLAQLCIAHPAAFERAYAGELQDLRAALAMQSSQELELTGLRVALTTQLHEDAHLRRADLVRNLILTALSNGKALTAEGLAKSVSDKLRLPRIVHVAWLQSELVKLTQDGFIDVSGAHYTITDAGKGDVVARTESGSMSLIDGRSKVQDLIFELTGTESNESEFRQVWNILKDGITTMFLSHGAQVLNSIASILEGKSDPSEHQDLKSQIDGIADRIRGIAGGGTRINEVAQAVVDMFSERQSPAFEWLAGICEVFLHLCTLGLEPASQQTVTQHLKEIDLLLDTDVALSLISKGEGNHNSVNAVLNGWKSLGGHIFVTEPVLEEMAHHAWMSFRDFERLASSLDKMSEAEMGRLVINVFVRGFVAECRERNEKCNPRRWQQYIGGFKGKHDEDYDTILAILNDDYACELLAEADADAALASELAEQLYEERLKIIGTKNAVANKDTSEKSSRDGRILAILSAHKRKLKNTHRTAYIVSGGLKHGERALRERTGETDSVILVAAVAWFLSLVPGVKLNATTLRTVLFDADIRLRIDPLERATLRYLHASEQFDMHLARRGTLKQAVRGQIKKQAEVFKLDPAEVERRIVEGNEEDVQMTASIIAAAVDEITLSKSERQIAALKDEKQKLQDKLERQQQRRNR
jgi:hypothetical protein